VKVAVLCGGSSFERAVSLRSGAVVEAALNELGHETELIDPGPDTARDLTDGSFDVAFVALHGAGGEDGTVQELLELVGIPYTGSRPGPCRAAFDKAQAKRRMVAAGVATPAFVALSATALTEFGGANVTGEAVTTVGLPMIAKPASGGSALGVRLVDEIASLPQALLTAASYDRNVVLEQYIAGRELSVAVIGTESPRCLPPVRIRPRHARWFDAEARANLGEVEFTCPPSDLDSTELAAVEDTALRAYSALDLAGFGRVDIVIDRDGTPQVLELNTVPGLTTTSIVPRALEAAGLPIPHLIDGLISDALDSASQK
jgi:D-alanine-D-alanine ligase